MSRRVFKYELPVDDRSHLLPFWAVHVAAHPDRSDAVLVWCEVDPPAGEDPTVEPFRVFGTGQPVPSGAAHCGTATTGPFVWHVYNTALCDEVDR